MPVSLSELRAHEALRATGFAIEEELPGGDLKGDGAGAPAGGRRYRVRHPREGEAVLEVQQGHVSPSLLRRLLDLRHRNLLRVLHAGPLGPFGAGAPASGRSRAATFLLHEAPAGLSLKDLRHGGPLSLEAALEALQQVAAGLAVLHQAGIPHGRVHGGNIYVYDREDSQMALGPPRLSLGEGGGEAERAADLRQLAALFGELYFTADAAGTSTAGGAVGERAPSGELAAVLGRLREPQSPRHPQMLAPRSTFELYAIIEAACGRDGLLSLEDSSAIRLPGGLAEVPLLRPLRSSSPSEDAEDATVEMEQLDPSELLAFAQPGGLQALQGLRGPLEEGHENAATPGAEDSEGRRRSRETPLRGPAPNDDSDDSGNDDASRTMPMERQRLGEDTPAARPPGGPDRSARARWGGPASPASPASPARWLVPLGAAAVLTLALALWVLWRAPWSPGG